MTPMARYSFARKAASPAPISPRSLGRAASRRWRPAVRRARAAQQTPADRRPAANLGPLDRAGQPERPGLGEEVVEEQAADDERQGGGRRSLKKRERQHHQHDLRDGGVAEHSLHAGLLFDPMRLENRNVTPPDGGGWRSFSKKEKKLNRAKNTPAGPRRRPPLQSRWVRSRRRRDPRPIRGDGLEFDDQAPAAGEAHRAQLQDQLSAPGARCVRRC